MTATPVPKTPSYLVACELEIIRNLIDSLLADKQPEEVEANLYSARLHLTRAIAESEKPTQEAANTDFCWTRSELAQRIVNASRDTERTRA